MRVLVLDELRAQDQVGQQLGPRGRRRRRGEQVVLEKELEKESSVHLHKESRELQCSCCVQDKRESAGAGHSVAGRSAPDS